jgi:hypothetical protein
VDEYVHSSIMRDSQKVEVTQMPTTWSVDTEHGIPVSSKEVLKHAITWILKTCYVKDTSQKDHTLYNSI